MKLFFITALLTLTSCMNPMKSIEPQKKEFVENYFGISMPKIIGPGGVPFMVHTETVNSLVNSIDNFAEFFQDNVIHPNLLTEFHLYSGYVLKQYNNYGALYNKTHYYNVYNICHSEVGNFNNILAKAQHDPNILTASIHRRAYKDLTSEQILAWNNYLKEKHLITHDLEFLV